jgi:hypothetical protein
MVSLLKLIAKLFGKNAINKTIGTRTNVIQLPNNEIKRYIKKDLNIEAASDEAVMNAKKEMEELLPDLPKMNDMERLVFEGNLRRLDNRINPPMAEVVEFGTKEKVTPEGITSLIKEKGQKAPPGTVMGNLESRVKQLEASGKSLEELTKGKGMTLDDIMSGALESQQGAKQLQREGLVRATARDIITADVKSGKLKLPKELQQDILEGGGEPIDVLRRFYGEDALEVLDSLTPEFSKLRTSTEAADLAKSKFKFEPDVKRPPGTIEDMPEDFATGGRVGFNEGSKLTDYIKTNISASTSSSSPEEGVKVKQEILDGIISLNIPLNKKLKLLGDLKFGKNRAKVDLSELGKKYGIDLGEEVYKDKYLSPGLGAEYTTDEGTKFNLMVNPEDKGGSVSVSRSFANGGSTGLDYLMGIDRTNYQNGGMTLQQLQAKAPPGEFLAYINPEEAGVLKALGGSGKKINGIPSFFASGPGDTGGAGGADGAGGNDEGGGGSSDTGDMGSEAANAAATAAGAASVGAGVGPTDPGVTVGSMMGNFGRNVANMARANPISSMIASAVLGPIGAIGLNAARAYGPTGTTGTVSTTESDGTGNALVQQAIADPLGLNAAARDMSGVDALQQQYRANLGYQSGGRVGFNQGTLDPAKQKQIKQMIKMGADVDTISAITGATPEQIQQIQQTPRTKNADGGRIGFKDGSKLPKEKTTLPINPMMDEGVDLNKRGFLKGAAGVGAGIAALGTGALRLARKGAKKAKDLDIIVSKNIDATDGSYGEMDYASYLYAQLKPYSEKSKKLLNKLSKEGKIKKEDNDFYVDIQDINDPSLDALEEIKKLKYDVNSADYALNPKTKKYEQVVTKIKDLRKSTSDNPFFHDSDYINDFESEAAEAAVDILQPKTAKEFIKERADLIEKTLKQRGDFASGGLSYLQGI